MLLEHVLMVFRASARSMGGFAIRKLYLNGMGFEPELEVCAIIWYLRPSVHHMLGREQIWLTAELQEGATADQHTEVFRHDSIDRR